MKEWPPGMSQLASDDEWQERFRQRFPSAELTQGTSDLGTTGISSFDACGFQVLQGFAPAFRLDRTKEDLTKNPSDRLFLSVLLQGSTTIGACGRRETYQAGDLVVIDEGEPYSVDAQETAFVALVLPRRMILEQRPDVSAYQVTATRADSPVAHLLARMVRCLADEGRAPEGPSDRPIRDAIVALIIGAIEIQGIPDGRAQQDGALHQRVRGFVTNHLAETDLTPERIAAGTGLSRSSLYRAFASTGGVSRFVRNCRIDKVRALLADPNERRSISELSLAFGFVSTGHFSRVFRERTGLSPKDFRASASEDFKT